MAGKAITNTALAWGDTNANNDVAVLTVVNNSGGTVRQGDVVVVDVTGRLATTTTTANNKSTLGVVCTTGDSASSTDTVAAGNPMSVAIGGVARINIGTNTVAVGDILCSSTTAKVAVTNAAATVGQGIAIALEANGAKDAQNCIRALIGKI